MHQFTSHKRNRLMDNDDRSVVVVSSHTIDRHLRRPLASPALRLSQNLSPCIEERDRSNNCKLCALHL